MKNTIYIAADHRGVRLKAEIVTALLRRGYNVADLGSHDENCPCDYPKYAFAVATRVAREPGARGILVCMSGIGHSIAANKVKGVYAALCYNKEAAVLSRQHNNANVLVLGAKFVAKKEMMPIITTWLMTDFEGGRSGSVASGARGPRSAGSSQASRHLRRVNQIKAWENKFFKKAA